MASSTLKFVDQNGNPAWGLATRIARDQGDTNKAEDERYPDRSGKTTFLEVKKVLPSQNGHTVHVNYNEGLNPNWADYLPLSKWFSDIEDPNQLLQDIVITKKGSNPPPPGNGLTIFNHPQDSNVQGFGTAQEWKPIAHEIVKKFGLTKMEPDFQHGGNGQQPNLKKFEEELKKVHPYCELQRNSGGEYKPRIFLPSSNRNSDDPPVSGKYSRIVDIGSFGFPFFHNSTSSDEWQLTGRPPNSKW